VLVSSHSISKSPVLSAVNVWDTVCPATQSNGMSYPCRWTSPVVSLLMLMVTVSFRCAVRSLGVIELALVTVTPIVTFWPPFDQNRLHDLYLFRRRLDCMTSQGFPQRLQQHLAGPAEHAADDDPLGVDQVAQPGDRDADLAPSVRDGTPRANVTVNHQLDHV